MTTAPRPDAPPPGTPRPRPASPAHASVADRPPLDLAGVGAGPAGLSLAALADSHRALRAAWFEQRPAFRWHPGLLIEGTTLQVPFLADLVTLADPTSPWSYLAYLRAQGRLFPFYFAETFHIERTDYDAYCRWAADRLASVRFGRRVESVSWDHDRELFTLAVRPAAAGEGAGGDADSGAGAREVQARAVALSLGSSPHVPEHLRPALGAPAGGAPVVHSADYLRHREQLLAAGHVTVVGSGQSGAEVFLDLLRRRPAAAERLHWLTRSPAFAPMEYSKLGLEHFTPDYTRYFHTLPETTRDALTARQWQLHKAVDHDTLAAIHGELLGRAQRSGWPDAVMTPGVAVRALERRGDGALDLHLAHAEQRTTAALTTGAVVLATGYRDAPLEPLLGDLAAAVRRDAAGRPLVTEDYRLELEEGVTGRLFVAGGERHTHGVGTPDLGLMAHRSATILNQVVDGRPYPLPERTAFTTFGLRSAPAAPADAPAPPVA
ncbi:lysine N(6)-hydroxylase/L-ornithine N(5)-oxygenase family protein [Streptomyces bohaiensis]|uniref:L-lysine N6-monooxygenase MbtG n=1 Tax=Streptomyces bohaiensis TaxID=1431344 RepID=A0ABX1CHK5_9ACTN|nr:SidA/IucD/PvdA family monooxygenase [Streptomyces bohaiensis]NJQ17315.1 SidA/IucD/PvdA family monooxygenase [Streptomyces bohaiensis]